MRVDVEQESRDPVPQSILREDNGHTPVSARVDPVRSAFDTAVDLLDAERATLLLREVPNPVLSVAASTGIHPRLAATIRVTIGEGIAGVVAEQGHAILGEIGGRTFLSVPIVTSEGIVGVLNATERREGKEYHSEDVRTALTAAAHLATLVEYERQIRRDPVSGLHTREVFLEGLQREVARVRRTGSGLTVMFLDLDNLKEMNDRYGHALGDAAIRAVGESIGKTLRPYDLACRFGGDEFAVYVCEASADGARGAATAILTRLDAAIDERSAALGYPLGISRGVALAPADGETCADLLASADGRMYEDKRRRAQRRR